MKFDDIYVANNITSVCDVYCNKCNVPKLFKEYGVICRTCKIFIIKNDAQILNDLYESKECSQCYISDCKDCTVYANYSKIEVRREFYK